MATIFPGRGTGARNRMSDSGMAVVAAFDVSWAGSTNRFAPPSSHEDMLLKISRGKPSWRATVAKSTTPWSVSAPRCDAPSFAAYVTRRNVVSGDLVRNELLSEFRLSGKRIVSGLKSQLRVVFSVAAERVYERGACLRDWLGLLADPRFPVQGRLAGRSPW